MITYSVWYLEGDLGLYGEVVSNRTVEARDIRSASRKVRRWSPRRDYLIAKKGIYVLEPGGGPLVLLTKKTEGKRNYMHIKALKATPMGVKT